METQVKPRLSRLTAIVTQLQANRLITATSLSEKYGVSVRTIYRDIRTLEQSGIPIVTEEGKGYTLMEGYKLPPIMFTENEANAFITAEQLIRKNKDQSLIDTYHSAITKIKAVLRNSQKVDTDLLSERILFRSNINQEITSRYLMTVQSAITKFNLLEIDYRSLKNQHSNRVIEPFALYSTQENWLLIAYCRLRKEFRAFRIDLIEKLSVKEECFEAHKMSLEDYFRICKEKYEHP